MKTSVHTNNLSNDELHLWICDTPAHQPTEMEVYLAGFLLENKELEEAEDTIQDLELRVEELEYDLEEAERTIEIAEDNCIRAEKQLERFNVVFPEDMVEFCREVSELQPKLKQLKKALLDRTHEAIRATNEKNQVLKENMDLKLQIKMFDAAGLEKTDNL